MDRSATGPVNTFSGPTGQSAIDYILVPQGFTARVRACHVIENEVLNTSDHNPVQVTLDIDNVRCYSKPSNTSHIKRWEKLSEHERKERYSLPLAASTCEITARLASPTLSESDLDECIEVFVEKMKVAASNIPSRKFRKHLKPYWNQRMNELKKDKIFSYREWVKVNRPRDAGNPLFEAYKQSKKAFNKELKRLSKGYDDEQISQAVKAAEVDRGQFWRLVKASRKGSGGKIAAINDNSGKTVSNIEDILDVWKTHFENLYTPKDNEEYDKNHYDMVTAKVAELNAKDDTGEFLQNLFTEKEIKDAIGQLHKRKACGYDGITTEHLLYGGDCVVQILTLIYNGMLRLEYIPVNLRRGIQIPLFKGKGTCCLDPNNYRGISLLTNLNKVYEVLIWGRIKGWWEEHRVISALQGVGKKKLSCVHTALLLQESVAYALESKGKVFVTFLDVSKAYDTVWTDGLFFRLYEMGINGKMWRLMYRAYNDFKSKVRIEDKASNWFPMLCGIHQGGFLSLTKYVTFINGLLDELEQSDLCCSIGMTPTTPVGYADDVATACTSKHKTDQSLQLVHKYGCKWRFHFNAKKSAILVYGESRKEHEVGGKFREFKLGSEKVEEKCEYDHVGFKACIFKDNNSRVEEKIGKGRRTLNAASGLGIRKSGITLKTCNLIFWTIVIPTLTFGCELWYVNDNDLEKIQNFQRYAGRRVQRFPKRSPSSTSYFGLGWIRIETFIQVKKMLFILTYLNMDADNRHNIIFHARVRDYVRQSNENVVNVQGSPIFEMLETCIRFDLLEKVLEMTFGYTNVISKKAWSGMVWEKAWKLDDAYWKSTSILHEQNDMLLKTIGKPQYLTWWHLADNIPYLQGMCENMARLVCHASLLKSDDPRYKRDGAGARMCHECDFGIAETIHHLIMQCPVNEEIRNAMFYEINKIDDRFDERGMISPGDTFLWIMGKQIENVDADTMTRIWITAGHFITRMYKTRLASRVGVG